MNVTTLYESIDFSEEIIAKIIFKGLSSKSRTQQINLTSIHYSLLECKGTNLFLNNDEKSTTFSVLKGFSSL
jgi:hypothetical protein